MMILFRPDPWKNRFPSEINPSRNNDQCLFPCIDEEGFTQATKQGRAEEKLGDRAGLSAAQWPSHLMCFCHKDAAGNLGATSLTRFLHFLYWMPRQSLSLRLIPTILSIPCQWQSHFTSEMICRDSHDLAFTHSLPIHNLFLQHRKTCIIASGILGTMRFYQILGWWQMIWIILKHYFRHLFLW